jgi:hypothetical protein
MSHLAVLSVENTPIFLVSLTATNDMQYVHFVQSSEPYEPICL